MQLGGEENLQGGTKTWQWVILDGSFGGQARG